MTPVARSIEEEALGWLVRVNDADFDQWDAFHQWLDSDPAHSQCYWRLARAEADATADLEAVPTASAERRTRAGLRWMAAGTGLAAAIALVVMFVPRHADDLLVETAPGTTRNVLLSDGSRIDVAGASRVRIARGDERQVHLESGEALFTVAHDAAHPFTVDVGGRVIRDVGTVFDVARSEDGSLTVGVAQGAVLLDPDRTGLTLTAGKKAFLEKGRQEIQVGIIDPATVGSWRHGRLAYDDAPLGQVASDIFRLGGGSIELDADLAQLRFTGTLLTKDTASLAPRAASLAGLEAHRTSRGWHFSKPTGNAR